MYVCAWLRVPASTRSPDKCHWKRSSSNCNTVPVCTVFFSQDVHQLRRQLNILAAVETASKDNDSRDDNRRLELQLSRCWALIHISRKLRQFAFCIVNNEFSIFIRWIGLFSFWHWGKRNSYTLDCLLLCLFSLTCNSSNKTKRISCLH